MDLLQSLDEYQRDARARPGRGRGQERAAVELLREYLVDYAGLSTVDAITLSDLEDLFARWYLQRDDAEADAAPRLVTGVAECLRWLDARSAGALAPAFAPLAECLREDLPHGFHDAVNAFLDRFPGKMDEYEGMLTKNSIWNGRTKGIGILTKQDVMDWGLLGPIARASGVKYDVRKAFPYLNYDTYDFAVPTQEGGDVYARYLTRVAEMRESWKICKQAIARITPTGEWGIDDPRMALVQQAVHGFATPSDSNFEVSAERDADRIDPAGVARSREATLQLRHERARNSCSLR